MRRLCRVNLKMEDMGHGAAEERISLREMGSIVPLEDGDRSCVDPDPLWI